MIEHFNGEQQPTNTGVDVAIELGEADAGRRIQPPAEAPEQVAERERSERSRDCCEWITSGRNSGQLYKTDRDENKRYRGDGAIG